jgi:hypothetical protein
MRDHNSPRPGSEVPAVKPDVFRLAAGTPLNAATQGPPGPFPLSLTAEALTQLKFVQIGIWQARARCLSGQTEDLDAILAHLDEDIELLRLALEDEPPEAPRTDRHKGRRCEAASLR